VPLAPAFHRERTFRVRRRGQAHFTEDARQKFKEYARLIRQAAETSERSADHRLYWLRQEARRTLEAQLSTILPRLEAASASAQPSLRQRGDKLANAIARVDTSDALEIARLLSGNKDARELAVLTLLTAAFISYPSSRPLMLTAVAGGIDLGAAALLEFRTDTIGAELLGRLPENERAKLLTLLPMAIFAQELARIQAIEEGAIQVRAFATRGILGELAADIGDACYSRVEHIMLRDEPSPITAVLFTTGEGINTRWIGSMLVLENRVGEQPVLILRALNPTSEFLQEYSAGDFIDGALAYLRDVADVRGGTRVVAPVELSVDGALSNRAEIRSAFAPFIHGEPLILAEEEDFNGYDLTEGKVRFVEPLAVPSPLV
jgi:hypothetical protein